MKSLAKPILLLALVGGVACGNSEAGPDADPMALSLEELVEAYQAGELSRSVFRSELERRPGADLSLDFPSRIAETLLLKAHADGPYLVSDDLVIEAGAVLVVAPGVEFELADGVGITAQGRLYAMGTDAEPVTLGGGAGRYRDVVLESGPNQFISTRFDRGERELVVAHGSGTQTLVENAVFDRWSDVAIDFPSSSGLFIRNSVFGVETADTEISGETIRARNSGFIQIENSSFGFRLGYFDVIDLQDCDPAPEEWPIIIGNRFDGGEDDAIDLDACSAYVVGNYIRNFRPADLAIKVAGVNGGGITGDQVSSKPILINNVIDSCFHGIGFKDGSQPTILHNTIINSNIGITLYQSDAQRPLPSAIAINNVLVGNTAWEGPPTPQDVVLNGKWWPSYNQVDDVQGSLDASYTITATGEIFAGEANTNSDPELAMDDGIPVPALGSSANGTGLVPIELPGVDLRDYLERDYFGAARASESVDRGAVNAR